MQVVQRLGFLILVLVTASSCSQLEDLPTVVPTIFVPTQVFTQTSTPSPIPSPVATEKRLTTPPTPVVVEVQPTNIIGSGVNITSPIDGETLVQGQVVEVSGLVQIVEGDTFSVSLRSASGLSLATADIAIKNYNSWIGAISIPVSIGGVAHIEATVTDQDGNSVAADVVNVNLTADNENTDRFLRLLRPTTNDVAVAGYHLFFDGIANMPVDNIVTISAWNESCQNEIARQSYRLRGSGYWQGFITIPEDIFGPICASARFGNQGEEDWREVQIPLNVIPKDDPQAGQITIGNPPPGSNLDPGQRFLFFGTAYNAPENQILVSVLLDNGRLLTENMTIVDYFGYWEVELFIPVNASGPAAVEASFGERGTDEFVRQTIAVTIGEPD